MLTVYSRLHTHTGTLYLLFMVTYTYCTVYSHIYTHLDIGTLLPIKTHVCARTCTGAHTIYLLYILIHTYAHKHTVFAMYTYCITYSYMHIVILPFLCTHYIQYTCFSL